MTGADRSEFADSHGQARERFLAGAEAAGARLQHLPIDARGPGGEPLAIDIAWCGPSRPGAALLHVSGIHGVEAFAGSAIQCQALRARLRVPGGCALIFVHVLNPWGMAWLRRSNENNVDLNRNFLSVDEEYAGTPPRYPAMAGLLNPLGPPRRDGFYLRALVARMRYGGQVCREAVLGGQYRDPEGLFYGGSQLEQGASRYAYWLQDSLAALGYLLVLDVHTGLGRYGRELLLYERGANHTPAERLAQALEQPIQQVPANAMSAYRVRGGHGRLPARLLPQTRVDFLTQEFGTFGMLRLLRELRDENRAYHHDPAGSAPWRQRLAAALNPDDPGWRQRVLASGGRRIEAALRWLERARINAS